MGQDKGSLIKQKQSCMGKQMKSKDLFSTSHQQVMSSHFLGSRASVRVAAALEDKCHNKECPPSS